MATQIVKVLNKGLIREQKTATLSDTAGQDGALFPSDANLLSEVKEASNAILTDTTGNVVVILAREDAAGVPIEDTLPNLIGGIWHNCEPFRQVKATGTVPTIVKVAVTSWHIRPQD